MPPPIPPATTPSRPRETQNTAVTALTAAHTATTTAIVPPLLDLASLRASTGCARGSVCRRSGIYCPTGTSTPAASIAARTALAVVGLLTMFMPRCTPVAISSGVHP